MKNVYTWAAKPAKRSTTVGDLKAAKGKKKFTQVTANTVDEAAAAEKAGFDMIIANAKNIIPVREGSKNLFLTAALASGQIPQNSNSYTALNDKKSEMVAFRNQSIIGLLLLVIFGLIVF